MALAEGTLAVLAVILFFGLVVPDIFKKFQLPLATSLIIVGSILGPNGFSYIKTTEQIELFGFLGAALMMVIGGLNAQRKSLAKEKTRVLIIAVITSIIPFITGMIIMLLLGYNLTASLVVGILFISTSGSLVYVTLNELKFKRHVGLMTYNNAIILDIFALTLFSLLLYGIDNRYPLPIYLGLLVSSVLLLKMFLPEVTRFFFKKYKSEEESKLRVVLMLLLFVLIGYSAFGVNPIIAAFLVGIALSDLERGEQLKHKIKSLAYTLFVPIFFFILGMEMDFRSLFSLSREILFIALFTGAFLSKFISGYIAAKLNKFSRDESMFFGMLSTSKLTTTLSATYAALLANLIDSSIVTAIALVSVLSTIISPLSATLWAKRKLNDN